MTDTLTRPADAPETVTLSRVELESLIRDVAQGGGILPPTAFREGGEVWRPVLEPTGRKQKRKLSDGTEVEVAVNRKTRRRVYLPTDTSPRGLIEAKRFAYRNALDLYHPQYGWLSHGCKRVEDVPENMGNGAQAFDMEYAVIESADQAGASTVSAQGVPLGTPPDVVPEAVTVAPSQSPFSDEALMDIPVSTRRQRGA